MQHFLHKPYVNEVTLNGQNLYLKCIQSSEFKLYMFRRLRSFKRGTVGLCRSVGCKVTSCQSWRINLLSRNRTRAAPAWFEIGQVAEFFSKLQLQTPKVTEGNKQRNETLTVSKQLKCCQFKSTNSKITIQVHC